MLTKRIFPENAQQLADLIRAETLGSKCVVIQAGHFLLYFDNTEAQILPGISGELSGPRQALVADELGHFPVLTWNLAVSMLDALSVSEKWAMVVVNDWQYLPQEADRADFYRQHPFLPESYRKVLAAYPSVRLLRNPRRPNLDTGEFFSEQSFRNAYERHVKELIQTKRLPLGVNVETGAELSCSLEDSLGGRKEVYCSGKRSGCEHEVAELASQVFGLTRANALINFFPLVCKEYVTEGTEIGFSLFRHGITKIVNVGMPATNAKSEQELFSMTEVIIHEF